MAGRHRAPKPPLRHRLAARFRGVRPRASSRAEGNSRPQTADELLHQLGG